MTLKHLSLWFLIFFAISCAKENTNKAPVYEKINPGLYPFLFDTGSYWVYRDVTTNNLDSVTLIRVLRGKYQLSPYGPGQGSPGDAEAFYMRYFAQFENDTLAEVLTGYTISSDSVGTEFISTKRVGDQDFNATILAIIGSMQVENKIYTNIIKMKIDKAVVFNINNSYNYYYSDNIGIIRKEKTVNDTIVQTWNLLRFKTNMLKY